MGMMKLFSDSPLLTGRLTADPNPRFFRVRSVELIGGCTRALVNFPDCTTYGGDKILVFRGDLVSWVRKTHYLDPHFLTENPNLIARFAGDQAGWGMAELFCRAMGSKL